MCDLLVRWNLETNVRFISKIEFGDKCATYYERCNLEITVQTPS